MIAALAGGIGLFLLGIILMTEGLKAAAGGALRNILGRLTGGPWQAFLSGMALTALVQSSHATTLTTIGFVSAGLLTFTQAVGVIFGANVGTTSTGWIVSLLGLRLDITLLAYPMVGIGAVTRLLAHGRAASLGLAAAGFGLIFIGIDVLQDGMRDLSAIVDLARFPATTFAGRLVLVGVGTVMTVVMQSSSAAVATTLTALHAGTIGLEQAAVLVIGQNVGTTVTAGFAAIGASVPARRTAVAHVLFNVFTGAVALALLPLLLAVARTVASDAGDAAGIAAFHTTFNVLGVLLLMPLIRRFAALVIRLVPERGPALTRNLDASVTELPAVALETARRTTIGIAHAALGTSRPVMIGPPAARRRAVEALAVVDLALAETRRFLALVRSSPEAALEHARHLAVLHALDHLDRLVDALREQAPYEALTREPGLRAEVESLLAAIAPVQAWLADPDAPPPVEIAEQVSMRIAAARRALRIRILEQTAAGDIDPDAALERLDAIRWIDRVAYHVWRAVHHLGAPAAMTLASVEERAEPRSAGAG